MMHWNAVSSKETRQQWKRNSYRSHPSYTSSAMSATWQVFDGHGGIGAASYVQAHILQHLADGLSGAPNMTLAFQAAYDLTDREFEIACAADKDLNSGTTAITMLITGR